MAHPLKLLVRRSGCQNRFGEVGIKSVTPLSSGHDSNRREPYLLSVHRQKLTGVHCDSYLRAISRRQLSNKKGAQDQFPISRERGRIHAFAIGLISDGG